VNYGFRFSGARRVCQPNLHTGIKLPSSPATFPTTLSISFFLPSFTVLHRPPSCLRPLSKLHLLPCRPDPSPSDTTWPLREMPQRDRWLLFARHLGSTVVGRPTVRLPLAMTVAGRSSRARATWSRDGLRCRTTATLLHASPTDPSHLLTSPPWTTTPCQHAD
jgi:hypothetical protein